MRVIFIAHQDYANFSYEKCESLRLMGVDCDSFVLKPHPFAYPKQSKQVTVDTMNKEIANADLIHVMHSCGTCLDLVKDKGKRLIVWHTGTRYRTEPEKHNARWNNIVERSFYALGEFEKLGCKNGEYFSVTVNENELPLMHCNDSKIKFAHFPSNPQVKGTMHISSVISSLNKTHRGKFSHNISVKRVGYLLQKKRMADCHGYIEMCASTQATKGGMKEYGSFGTTALECAMMGKVVFTNFLWEDIYKKYYGEHKLIVSNSKNELQKNLERFINMDLNEVRILGEESREWSINSHGRKATGERLIKYL